MFAARGKRLCCHPRKSDQFCNQGIFQDFGHRGVNQPLGPLLSPFHSLPSPRLSLFPLPFPTPSLRSGPLNPVRRSGERCKHTGEKPRPKLNLVHFSLKIWHPVATNLKVFPRIRWPKFIQNFQILCRIWKHANSAKHWIVIASKTVVDNMDFLQFYSRWMTSQSGHQCKFLGVQTALCWVS